MDKIQTITRTLQLIADGTPFEVSHLHDDQYIILVTNDLFETEQDLGHDPFHSLVTTGPA